jgi:hypothetical protein
MFLPIGRKSQFVSIINALSNSLNGMAGELFYFAHDSSGFPFPATILRWAICSFFSQASVCPMGMSFAGDEEKPLGSAFVSASS